MKKVLVGLSGGVDSAVAAYLLKEQGYDVTCCFMRNWDSLTNQDILGNPTLNNEICTQEADYNDALSVANKLGLELLRVDFIQEYWDNVFESFLSEYKRGRTPNPDILCNKYIKFSKFFDYAMERGFDYIATGHYAAIDHETGSLLKAHDLNKDQSYFLAQVDRTVLDKVLFPLGEIDKTEVRRIALDLDLDIALKKDSTGICFIGERNFKEFLDNYLPSKRGNIISVIDKKVVGEHSGVLYYTIGQRKGLGIGGDMGPWFVVGKNIYTNELYVSNQEEDRWLLCEYAYITDVNWLRVIEENSLDCKGKFRYRQNDIDVRIEKIEEGLKVIFDKPLKSVTPGQQAVFYLNDVVIAGGVIDQVFYDNMSLDERLGELTNGEKNN